MKTNHNESQATQQLQRSQKMTKALSELTKRYGILSIDYRQEQRRDLRNGKYWDIAEATSLNNRRTFTVNHYGEIFEEGKLIHFRTEYSKPTVKICQYA